ncbi:MAG: HD domain-containing protein [Spirochaetales bacterium]|nr:HD domain-containing protein [Spirochaetales bacterium]
MKKVSTNSLPVNAYIDKPVFLEPSFILAAAETPITQKLINRLQKWRYGVVYTDGSPTTIPPNTDVHLSEIASVSIENNIEEKKIREEVQAFYRDLLKFLKLVFDRFQLRGELRILELSEKVKDIITYIREKRKYITSIQHEKSEDDNYLVVQSIKTTVLSLVIADYLKIPPHRQIELGVASLIHQIGMLRIPQQVYMTERILTDAEKKTIKAYPVIGFKILKELEFPPAISVAVLDHRENMDGTGYPRQLTSDKISLYGKILGVASAYTAATGDRPFKNGIDGHSGIMDMVRNSGKKYDDNILRALVYTLSVYPVGTYVLLSNGAKGIVIETNPEQPKFPVIRLLVDENGKIFLEQPILQTSINDDIQIARGLTSEEVKSTKNAIEIETD